MKKNLFQFVKFEYVVIFLMGFFFLFTLFGYQVGSGNENFAKAQANINVRFVEIADRGDIYSVDGVRLAEEVDVFKVRVPSNVFDESLIDSNSFSIDDVQGYVEISTVDESKFIELKDLYKEEGVIFLKDKVRVYPYSYIYAHTLGYVGNPKKLVGRSGETTIRNGVSGIEQRYDEILSGEDGVRVVNYGPAGNREEIIQSKSEPGGDLRLNLNHSWQTAVYFALADNVANNGAIGASMIVLDSDSGEVVVAANYPSFDSNLFVEGISLNDYESYTTDNGIPLLNRYASMALPPGSTFKTVVGLAAMSDSSFDPNGQFYSSGCEQISSTVRFCEADGVVLGSVDFKKAIARSSNLYFCDLGRGFAEDSAGDIRLLNDFVYSNLGFGERTGVDVSGEVLSRVSGPEQVRRSEGRDWSDGDTCNAVIGQGGVVVTPVRMAVNSAAFVNGGYILRPLIANIEDGELISSQLSVASQDLVVLNDAMRETVLDTKGTANLLSGYAEEFDLRLKTGSADSREVLVDGQIKDGAHSWVVGTFNFNGEDYSFALVHQFGGRGFRSLPVLEKFLQCLQSDFEGDCRRGY